MINKYLSGRNIIIIQLSICDSIWEHFQNPVIDKFIKIIFFTEITPFHNSYYELKGPIPSILVDFHKSKICDS